MGRFSSTPIDQSVPLPPSLLRYKVAGTDDAEWFEKSGEMSRRDLERALASIGRSFDEFNDVLEWGCGCGRILRHISCPVSPRRICGNDIDPEAISWVSKNLPWIETSRTDGMPPLPYGDSSFDLIFNHSVMTHLDAAYQDAWLAELRRVLRPGGVLTLTVSGRHSFKAFLDTLPANGLEQLTHVANLNSNGIVFIAQDQWSEHFPGFYHTTFHDVTYIFNHWSKFLNVRCYLSRGALDNQDMIVLQKPMDEGKPSGTYLTYLELFRNQLAEQQRPGVGSALGNDANTAEVARLAEMLRQARSELKGVYASRSWSLTKPWRSAGNFLKRFRTELHRRE